MFLARMARHLVTYTSRRYGDVLLFCLALVDVDFWDVSSWGKYSHTRPEALAPPVPCHASEAMRASRETELAKDYPIHVVTAWSGNTPRIAMKHYLQVTDDDFERAAQGGAQVAQNAAQHAHVSLRTHSQETTKAPAATRAYANGCDTGRESATASSGEDRIRTCGPVARSRI